MNNLNEIIVSFENEKNNYFQQTHSEENINKDKIYDESQITYLLYHFYENLGKRLYKKTIKEIDSLLNGQNIDEFDRAWKIYILRIRAQLKVIQKKIEKYLIRYVEKNKLKYKINSIKKYLNQVLENLIIFVEKFSVSKKDEVIEKVDNLLHCYFEYIYLYCLFNKKIGKIIEIITYLSFSVSLFNQTKLILKSNHTLFYLEKCILLVCQMLISNGNCILALNYINLATKICLHHLIYHINDFSDGIFIDDKKKSVIIEQKKDNILLNKYEQEMELEKSYGDKNIKQIILNLIFVFYFRGICYENIGKINFSIKAYYQCSWFINNFFYHSPFKIPFLIKNTIEKSLEVKRAIDYIMRRIRFYDRMQFFLKKQFEKKKSKEENKDIMYNNLLKGNKLKELENKLSKLNINEVDTINRFDVKKNIKEINGRRREGTYKNIFMSDTRLLNSFLREDFRHIIDSMDKIKTFDIDLATREKIQKFLRGIYFEQSLKKFRQKNKIKNIRTYYTINTAKNRSGNLNKNQSTPNTFRQVKNILNKNKNEIITTSNPVTKRRILSSNSTFRLTQVPNSKNYSKNLLPNTSNKTMRPKSSIPRQRQVQFDIKSKMRVFTPISTTRNYFEYKNKTMPLSKTKNKNSKSIRSRSALLIKRVPTEDKNLNKFFNKKYLIKRNYIKVLEERDLKFQKCILKIKKDQKPKNEIYTKETMKENAKELFQRVMGLYLTTPSNWKINKETNPPDKETRLKEKLQDALISSLDNAAIIKYNIQKTKQRNKSKPMTEQMNLSLKDVNIMNKNIIKDIDNKIEEIKQREIIENKNYQRILKRNRMFLKYRKERSCQSINRDKIRSPIISPISHVKKISFNNNTFNRSISKKRSSNKLF